MYWIKIKIQNWTKSVELNKILITYSCLEKKYNKIDGYDDMKYLLFNI